MLKAETHRSSGTTFQLFLSHISSPCLVEQDLVMRHFGLSVVARSTSALVSRPQLCAPQSCIKHGTRRTPAKSSPPVPVDNRRNATPPGDATDATLAVVASPLPGREKKETCGAWLKDITTARRP